LATGNCGKTGRRGSGIRLKDSIGKLAVLVLLVLPVSSWAAHPLITDDTGTQGTGKFQVEVNGEFARDKEVDAGIAVESTGAEIGVTLAAGVREDLDVVVGMPFVSYKVEAAGATIADEQGPGDVVLEAKWRLLEQGGLSLAVKPGITIPTGDEDKGLGTGKTGCHLFLIATREAEPVALHANLGYIRNENNAGEEEDLWHVSAAAEYSVVESTRLVGNIGMEKNPDPAADDDPAFGLLGVIYSPGENIDLDAGVKFGLNDAGDDLALLAGIAIRF
jgi:hypothetical protein